MSAEHLSDTTFSDLDLHPWLQENLRDIGFTHCTPIQSEALPVLLAGRDVAGQAQTGTGKTATFLLAILNILLTRDPKEGRAQRHPRAFIMAPTRELVIQIHKDAEALIGDLDISLGLAYGGVDYEKQRQVIEEGVDLLVGTPGRLIDYYKQRVYSLSKLDAVVLDEADRMFDLGFIKDVRWLLRKTPPPEQRLNMLFSATLSSRVSELAYEHMNSPQPIKVEAEKITADRVEEVMYHVANQEKIPLLLGLLKLHDFHRTMIFANMKGTCENVWGYVAGAGYRVGLMTGDVPQKKRQRLLGEFQRGELDILVATDVAARGLHIDGVSHVINFDLPEDAEDYVHRIGRTARAGAKGDAISFGCETYVYSIPEIEDYIGHKIPTAAVESEWLVEPGEKLRLEKGPPRSSDGKKRGGGRRRSGRNRS
ncbi:MAG TPA: ATP-dependent RNA helicase RhlB [Gammaproteobacteria bacterium]|nr:ATP-dependent RNA helicase RhlB [Gammaproteobacteria bacterium]